VFPQYRQCPSMDFRQTFVIGASWTKDELVRFWGQEVKGQGHIVAAKASLAAAVVRLSTCCPLLSCLDIFCSCVKHMSLWFICWLTVLSQSWRMATHDS